MRKLAIAAAFCLLPVMLSAQWINFKQPGIPRRPDDKPDLTAPVPRAPDGKPDLSGFWGGPGGGTPPADYPIDLIQDVKDETIFKPAAEALFQSRLADPQNSPNYHCLPGSPARGLTGSYRLIQSPTVVALLFNAETGDDYRQIFLDGRELPRDPNPTWHGYSVGHWEKSESGASEDTLVVESAGFNDRSWLDFAGHPHSESLRLTERYRRIDFGHMQVQVTFEDPETMTRPLTLQGTKTYRPDTDMLEGVCENERDARHLAGSATEDVKLSVAILAKFAGTYERGGSSGIPFQRFTLTLANDQLYLGALRLTPQSETSFRWYDGTAFDFSVEASGKVTGVTRMFAQGSSQFFRKR